MADVIPYDSPQYELFRTIDDMNFINSMIFELNMRKTDFKKLYNNLEDKIKSESSVMIIAQSIKSEEQVYNPFEEYGYEYLDIVKYIEFKLEPKKNINSKNPQFTYIDAVIDSLTGQRHDKNPISNQIEFDKATQFGLQARMNQLTALDINYIHPRCQLIKNSTFDFYIQFNLSENREVVKNKMLQLVDYLYDNLDSNEINYYDPIYVDDSRKYKIDHSLFKQKTSQKQKEMFAEYLWIYDNIECNKVSGNNLKYKHPNYCSGDEAFKKYIDRVKKAIKQYLNDDSLDNLLALISIKDI